MHICADMIGSIDKRFTILRGGFTLGRTIEAFLDPVLVVGLLLFVAYIYGDLIDNKFSLLALLIFSVTFPGDAFLHQRSHQIVRKTFFDWIFIASMLLLFGYASEFIVHFNERTIFTWLILAPFALMAAQVAVKRSLPHLININGNKRRAVIAGCNDVGLRLAKNFQEYPHEGIEFAGFFDDRDRTRLSGIHTHPLQGNFNDLPDFIRRHRIDRLYLALPMASQPRILKLLDDLRDTTASIFFVPDIFVTDLIQGRLDDIAGMPVVAVCETPFTGFNGLAKRIMDVLLASLILVVISPILLLVALAVRFTSPGPIIFSQRRYGLDGREILVYKFRSMSVTEDGDKNYTQVVKGDVRVTPLGTFIRATSLDELPQFINVLQGRMSIVGPRPHAVAVNEQYRKLISGYMVRHKVKPGITGWAQVNGYRGGDDLDHMKKRIEFDLEYLRSWSLSLDAWIVFKTLLLIRGDKQAY